MEMNDRPNKNRIAHDSVPPKHQAGKVMLKQTSTTGIYGATLCILINFIYRNVISNGKQS
jgi:hypothetical protein